MAEKFFLRMVTAENPYFEDDCTELKIPAHDGMIGVRVNHAPFVTELGTGVAEVALINNEILKFAVQNGFIQIADNEVTVVAEKIQKSDGLSADDVQNQLGKCKEKIVNWDKSVDREKLKIEYKWLKTLSSLCS